MTLTAGQCVQLKSGGPLMTIRFIESGKAYCQWFLNGKVEGAEFVVVQLVVPEAPHPSQNVPERSEGPREL
jgi:uncharacterized protein YodC (DUF2158 family)